MSSGFNAHLAPGLTRKVCQECQDLRELQDEQVSAPQRLPASADPLAFATLDRLRHSHQLSTRAQPTSQTLFLVQLCLAVFRLDLVKKEQCTSVCTKNTPVLLLSETTKRQNLFLNCTRLEKHSNCWSFWKFVCHQSSSVVLESCSTCSVDSRIRQQYLLSWIRDQTSVEVCTTVKKQLLCASLSPCGRHGIDCHTHDPQFHV